MTNPHKTNVDWYAYPDMGCWFRLVDGMLQAWPMTADGQTTNDEPVVVELAAVDTEERDQLAEVIRDLRMQP